MDAEKGRRREGGGGGVGVGEVLYRTEWIYSVHVCMGRLYST